MSERVPIGRIRAAHGIRGEVKVETYDRASTSLRKGSAVFVEGEGDAPRVVRAARPQRDWWIVALDGVASRNDAEALHGRELSMERAALPTLAAGEFYIADVIGFTAVLEDGTRLGDVTGATDGAQTLLVVRTPEGRDLLIPCVEGIVLEIRRVPREVLVDPPEGLLDL